MLGLGIASEEGFFYAVGKGGVTKAHAELAREGSSRVPASKTVSLGKEEWEEEYGQSMKRLVQTEAGYK